MTDTDLRAALERLVSALDRVHGDEGYRSVWVTAQAHLGPYQGPNYTAELEQARAALAAPAADGLDVERLRETAVRYLATDGFHGMWDAMEFRRASTELVTLLGGESVILAESDRIAAYLREPSREPGEEG